MSNYSTDEMRVNSYSTALVNYSIHQKPRQINYSAFGNNYSTMRMVFFIVVNAVCSTLLLRFNFKCMAMLSIGRDSFG